MAHTVKADQPTAEKTRKPSSKTPPQTTPKQATKLMLREAKRILELPDADFISHMKSQGFTKEDIIDICCRDKYYKRRGYFPRRATLETLEYDTLCLDYRNNLKRFIRDTKNLKPLQYFLCSVIGAAGSVFGSAYLNKKFSSEYWPLAFGAAGLGVGASIPYLTFPHPYREAIYHVRKQTKRRRSKALVKRFVQNIPDIVKCDRSDAALKTYNHLLQKADNALRAQKFDAKIRCWFKNYTPFEFMVYYETLLKKWPGTGGAAHQFSNKELLGQSYTYLKYVNDEKWKPLH